MEDLFVFESSVSHGISEITVYKHDLGIKVQQHYNQTIYGSTFSLCDTIVF